MPGYQVGSMGRVFFRTVPPVTMSKTSHDTLPTSQARTNLHLFGGIRDTSMHNSSLKLVRTFQAPAQNCRWTITDATLSPDNNWLAYSSISPYVHLVKTRGEDAVLGLGLEEHEQEVLCLLGDGWPRGYGSDTGIWSLRFDSQGRELVAGCTRGKCVVLHTPHLVNSDSAQITPCHIPYHCGNLDQGASLHMT
jgi:WD repeat-containing protein 23